MVRAAILLTHPTQYHTPWFQELAKMSGIDIEVFYCLKPTEAQQGIGFGVEFQWDFPLLNGYRNSFLTNVSRNPGFHFRGCDTPEIADLVGSRRFDAWIINGWRVLSEWQAIRACWHQGVPMLIRGDSHLLEHRPLHTRAAKRILLGRWIPRFARYLTVGKLNEEYYRFYGADPARFFAVRHFVDTERFARQVAAATPHLPALRKRWNIPADVTCFVFAGKFIEKKKPLHLVKAVEGLVARRHRLHLLMVGDGNQREVCKFYAERHQLPITFAGFLNQSEIATAYAVADVLVLPSECETWGLVVNEAMACGLPAVVSSRVGCAPDLVRQGKTGFVFHVGDLHDLIDAMSRYCKDKNVAVQHGRSAQALIQEFSVPEAAQTTRAAILSLSKQP